jgi:polyisoprenoid-binding protein YceI
MAVLRVGRRIAALLVGLVPALVFAAPATYPIDPERSEIVAHLSPAGLLRGVSHPHVIVAREISGEMVYDAEAPERSSVRVQAPAEALENDDPALRKKYGLDGTLDEGDRKKVAAGLRAEDQLDTGRFPSIAFASSSVRRLDGEQLEVTGRLTIRGVSAEISLPVRVTLSDGVLSGEGTVRITHAMFKFEPFSTALGTIRNAEEIVLRVALVGRAKVEPPDAGPGPGTDGGP